LPGSHEPEQKLFPYSRFGAYHLIRSAGNRAGLKRRIVSPHVFRHTHATVAVEAGIPIQEVADQLGHADLRTTQIYVNLRPGPRSGRAIDIPGGDRR
jgi:integrase/recombinase XerD